MKNQLFVFSGGKKFKRLEFQTKKKAEAILKTLKIKNSAVEIYLVGGGRMRLLNRKFKGKNKQTNILSFVEPKNFPHPEKEKKTKILGEIYLNVGQVADWSNTKKPEKYLSLNELLVHGLLHLTGYIHNKKSDRIKMEKKERSVLSRLCI